MNVTTKESQLHTVYRNYFILIQIFIGREVVLMVWKYDFIIISLINR